MISISAAQYRLWLSYQYIAHTHTHTHTKNVQTTWIQKGSCNGDWDLDEKFKQYYMENVNSQHTSAEGLTNRCSNSAHTLRQLVWASHGNDDDGCLKNQNTQTWGTHTHTHTHTIHIYSHRPKWYGRILVWTAISEHTYTYVRSWFLFWLYQAINIGPLYL